MSGHNNVVITRDKLSQMYCDIQTIYKILKEGILDFSDSATEATLLLILESIQRSSEFETKQVSDNNGDIWLEVRTRDIESGDWNPVEYYVPGSNTPGSPVLPVEYVDLRTLLATIVSNTAGINQEATQQLILTELQGTLDVNVVNQVDLTTLETTLSQVLTATQNIDANTDNVETLLGSVITALDTLDSADDTTELNSIISELGNVITELQSVDANTTNLESILSNILTEVSPNATEATLSSVDSKLTGVSRTPSALTATVDGSTTGGVQSVSLWFRGGGGTLDAQPVPGGTRVTYTPPKGNDTVGSIPYTVPTGGAQEIIITYLT